MSDYLYAEDGKIHTRYTELVSCTPGQIERVLAERMKLRKRFTSDRMDFGTDRHAMWEEESKRTGRLPEVFGFDWPVSHAEVEFATELLPGVVVHSRPDAVCADVFTVVDYKTLCADSLDEGIRQAAKMYAKSRQLPFYGFQVGIAAVRIKQIAYLIEVWNRDQDTILGYHAIVKQLPMSDMAKMLPWVKDRVAMLVSAVEEAVVA